MNFIDHSEFLKNKDKEIKNNKKEIEVVEYLENKLVFNDKMQDWEKMDQAKRFVEMQDWDKDEIIAHFFWYKNNVKK